MDHVLGATLMLNDKFTAVIGSAQTALTNFKGKTDSFNLNKMKNEMGNVTGSANLLKGALGALGVGIGLGAAVSTLKDSVLQFADLEAKVKKTKAIMGATAEQEAILMKQTKDLGASTVFTAQQVAEAQAYQAMAGMKTNEVLEMTPKLLKLSIASGEDLARVSDIVTDNLSAFGLGLKDTDHFLDVLAATSNNSNTSISMLGEAFSYVAANSRNFDSFDEVATMLGILADNGIKASKAGTGLSGIYSKLSKVTPEMRKQFEKVGLKLYDKNGQFKGLRKVIAESKVALAKLTEEERNYFLATVAGTEGAKIWNSIMNYSVEGTQKVESAVKNASGTLDTMADEMSGTTKNKIAEFTSALDGVKIALGEGLAPIATEVLGKITDYITELRDEGKLDPENITKFFNEVIDKAKVAAEVFLAAQIAFLALRASSGDPIAIAQLGTLAAAGVGLGVYAGLEYSDGNKKKLRSEYDKKVDEYYQTDYGKREKQAKTREELIGSITTATSSSYGAARQLEYERAANIVDTSLNKEHIHSQTISNIKAEDENLKVNSQFLKSDIKIGDINLNIDSEFLKEKLDKDLEELKYKVGDMVVDKLKLELVDQLNTN